MLGRLAFVDEPRGDLDDDFVQRRAELLLEDDFRAYITGEESGSECWMARERAYRSPCQE